MTSKEELRRQQLELYGVHEHTYDPTETTDGCCLKCGEDFYDSKVYLKQQIALLKKMLRRAQPYASGMGNRKFYEEIEKALGDTDGKI